MVIRGDFMMKFWKAVLALAILAAVVYGAFSLVWFNYVRINFGPVLADERLVRASEFPETLFGGRHYYFNDEENGFTIFVYVPGFWDFSGNIGIMNNSTVIFPEGGADAVRDLSDITVTSPYWAQVTLYTSPERFADIFGRQAWQRYLFVSDIRPFYTGAPRDLPFGIQADLNANLDFIYPDNDKRTAVEAWFNFHEGAAEKADELLRYAREFLGKI